VSPIECLITDRRRFGASWREAVVAQVARAAQAGVTLVQVREADLDGGPLYDLVAGCVAAVRGTRTRVVVNERLDVVLAAGAHGVHLRSDGIDSRRVRAQCPRPLLVGRSIHTLDEAGAADPAVLDYLVFGTVFPSASKVGRPAAGLDALAAVAGATTVPVLAVGGVSDAVLADVMGTGAAGVAAIGWFVERFSPSSR
jgi:thiamine-phosphate pyrophosphorylase